MCFNLLLQRRLCFNKNLYLQKKLCVCRYDYGHGLVVFISCRSQISRAILQTHLEFRRAESAVPVRCGAPKYKQLSVFEVCAVMRIQFELVFEFLQNDSAGVPNSQEIHINVVFDNKISIFSRGDCR